jgi:tetratricopeptide (TPR) repeat protein
MKKVIIPLLLLCLAAPVAQAWNIPFLTTDEAKAEELYNKALDLEVQDKKDKALIYYKDVVTRYPDTQAAKAVREKLAIYDAEKIHKEQTEAANKVYQKALDYESRQDFDNSRLYYQDVVKRYPNSATAQLAQEKLNNLPTKFNRYLAYPYGTAKDTVTSLIWMRCSVGQEWDGGSCTGEAKTFTWEEIKDIRLEFAGYTDWRLPSIEELRTLVYCSNGKPEYFNHGKPGLNEYKRDELKVIGDAFDLIAFSGRFDWGCQGEAGKNHDSPTIVPSVFQNTPSSFVWSSNAYGSNSAWGVYFYNGNDNDHYRNSYGHVRLVRGGQ